MKGATLLMLDYISLDFISIHAPMKGATPRPWEPRTAMLYFNPRTHEGCDAGLEALTGYDFISIHAPMKGATKCPYKTGRIPGYFNPRTHEGCDSLQINSVIACFSIIYIAN